MIQDPLSIVAYLAALVALVFQLERWPVLRPLFARLPALVWTYFLPMLSTSAGLLPADSPVLRAMGRYLLLPCLALLLLSTRLRAVARLGRPALLVMTVGMAGIAGGTLLAFAALRPWLPPQAWKAAGALCATWIGGSANLVAVSQALDTPPELQGLAILTDTVVGYTWMGVLIWLAGRQAGIDRRLGADRSALDDVAARLESQPAAPQAGPLRLADLALMLGWALGSSAVCLRLGRALPPLGQVLGEFSWAVVLLTAGTLLLSLTPLARLEAAGASTVGYAGFYLLLASVGAQADLRRMLEQPQFALLGVLVIAFHALLLLVALRLWRLPVFFLGAASQACVGGYSSAPLVAALYEPQMAAVGLLLAVLGHLVGTFAGLAVAQVLASW